MRSFRKNLIKVGIKLVEQKIGIVGGSGFVGSAIARHLIKSYKIKIVDIKPISLEWLKESEIEFEKCDIRKYSQVKESLEDVDLIIHTAIVQIPLINEAKKLGYQVNVLGTQNLCRFTDSNPRIKGLILSSSWHVFGESGLKGKLSEEFGFRPDNVQERARLYALCKIAQESVVRIYDELSEKIFGVIRLGTVLGNEMPKKTAANLFISKGLKGETITPYSDSMYRPMLYADLVDIQRGFESYAKKILDGLIHKKGNSLDHIVNLFYPKPITIIELAEIIQKLVIKETRGNTKPKIEIVDTKRPNIFTDVNLESVEVDISRIKHFLELDNLISPQESLNRIIKERLA